MTYKTKQAEMILTCLKSIPNQHVTANDVRHYFLNKNLSISTATIYRQLEKMVDEGILMKYIVDNTNSACFAYVDEKENTVVPMQYHFKCLSCGKIIHIQCKEIDHLQQHVLNEHGFSLDPQRLVFYGTCQACRTKL